MAVLELGLSRASQDAAIHLWRRSSVLWAGMKNPAGRQDPSFPATRVACPPPLTRIFGRDEVIAEIAGRLPRKRLVTITGTGGIGKTAVALAVARQLAGRVSRRGANHRSCAFGAFRSGRGTSRIAAPCGRRRRRASGENSYPSTSARTTYRARQLRARHRYGKQVGRVHSGGGARRPSAGHKSRALARRRRVGRAVNPSCGSSGKARTGRRGGYVLCGGAALRRTIARVRCLICACR